MMRLCRVKTGIIRGFFRQSKTALRGQYEGSCTKVINILDLWHHSWCGGGAYTSRQAPKAPLKVGKETPLEKTNHVWFCCDTAVSWRIFSEFRSCDKVEATGEWTFIADAGVRSDREQQLPDATLKARVIHKKITA